MKTWAAAVSPPGVAAAAVGAVLAWRGDRSRAAGLVLGAAMAGPLFVIVARLDTSNWVACTALEPAFLLPAMSAAVFAGEAVARLKAAAPWTWGILAAGALVFRSPFPERRDDFLAHDYARNLRRAVPPGGRLLAGGDTALFGMRWLELTEPRAPGREVSGAAMIDEKAWLGAGARRGDDFVTGFVPRTLRPESLFPEGLVQRVASRPRPAAAIVVLRRPRGWARNESYVRDAKLSYAFAAWSSARLLEARGLSPSPVLDMSAAAMDPEDYQLESFTGP